MGKYKKLIKQLKALNLDASVTFHKAKTTNSRYVTIFDGFLTYTVRISTHSSNYSIERYKKNALEIVDEGANICLTDMRCSIISYIDEIVKDVISFGFKKR